MHQPVTPMAPKIATKSPTAVRPASSARPSSHAKWVRFSAAAKELGLSDKDLGALLQVSATGISLWSNEQRPVPDYVLASIEAHVLLRRKAPGIFKALLNQRLSS